MQSSSISKTFFKAPACYITFLAVPAFFVTCVVSAEPFGLQNYLDMGRGLFTFNLSIIAAIMLVTLTLTRMLVFILRKRLRMNWGIYIIWCMGEAFMVCFFSAFYLMLMSRGADSYYHILLRCLLNFSLIMALPYTVITLGIQCYVLSHKKAPISPEENALIRFYDEHQRVRFIIAGDAVLYIKAEENYVRIRYVESGKVKDYTLRASMRKIEEIVTKHGLMRCHRSYYINPAHVRLVRKDSAGLTLAEMDVDGVESVPVSKNYYDSLTRLL